MYKCMICGFAGEKPAFAYEKDGSISDVCEHCKSTGIHISAEKCGVCGAALYKGEYAYEAGDLLVCERCLERVLV